MTINLQHEQKHLDAVLKTITAEIDKLHDETTKRKNEVITTRKHFWDEVKINTDTFDDYLETIIGLRQEAQALSVSQSSHRHASNRLSTLKRMEKVPYFGRIDFKEDGSSDYERIYIGISSLSDKDGEDFLIYDWRAPISSVYYDYPPGTAHYVTPSGVIHGHLEKKYQYIIRDGNVDAMFDTSLTIGDEILQQVLGKGTNKQMQSIVATIQHEQNTIIRHDQGRLLIVHGAAGSGKTSAALQRIAYLLYKYREHITAEQIILFSPNSMFSSYVSNVLPELGEENMQQVTFQEYLYHRLGEEFDIEHPYEQLEYILTSLKTPLLQTRKESIQFKASTDFFQTIQAYRKSLENSGMLFLDITFRNKTIINGQQLSEEFYSYDESTSFSHKLEKLQNWLTKEIKAFQKRERHQAWVQEEMELLSEEDYHKARILLAKKRGYQKEEIADYEVEPTALAYLIVHQRLKPLRNQIHLFEFIDFKGIYTQIFSTSNKIEQWISKKPLLWDQICQSTIDQINAHKLNYEDATPFLLLKEMILGFQTNRSIKHIVIDEAQDYSPFQFEFLKRLFPAARMTVLGDFNQAIFTNAQVSSDFKTLSNLYGPEQTALIELTRSYRSTKPIIEFTRRLVANGKDIIPFNRNGDQPVLSLIQSFDEQLEAITSKVIQWQEQGYQSIAIICKSAEESLKAFQALSHIQDIKLLKSSSLEYEQGIVIVPSYLSKGIEFDAVIVFDASNEVYGEESLRRLFYTVCTRAMHQIHLLSKGKPSFLLNKPLEEKIIQLSNQS
ncbi:ATP-dependent DNA helicase replicase [Bacillus sp. TS-2]|nr:ATP-dependent DNA helicase replicase [Bacillus sp. TS-2]